MCVGKCIEVGDYWFDVSIVLLLLGEVFGYGGLMCVVGGD